MPLIGHVDSKFTAIILYDVRYVGRCWTGAGLMCPQRAFWQLHDAEGERVPGHGMCWQHAQSCVDEYREKLGWHWAIKLRRDMPIIGTVDAKKWLLDIKSNGSKWMGEEPDTVDVLLWVLAENQLDPVFAPFISDADAPGYWCHDLNPYGGIKGVVHFFGNFARLSHVFSVFTNNPFVVTKLRKSIKENLAKEWPVVYGRCEIISDEITLRQEQSTQFEPVKLVSPPPKKISFSRKVVK
jgi:hypothetical protein